MNIKSYLNQARDLDKLIDSKLEQIDRLRSLAEKTTTTLTGMPHATGTSNRVEYCIGKIMELEKEVTSDIDKLIDTKSEIRKMIDAVQDTRYRLLLEYRYLCDWSWDKIAETMHYDVRWITELHGRALQSANSSCLFHNFCDIM